jgi:hypothetical protein
MNKDPIVHLNDAELLLYLNGELDSAAAESTRRHLDSCWTCRMQASASRRDQQLLFGDLAYPLIYYDGGLRRARPQSGPGRCVFPLVTNAQRTHNPKVGGSNPSPATNPSICFHEGRLN